MTKKNSKNKKGEYDLSREEVILLKSKGIEFSPANLSETMGPNWKTIYFFGNRPWTNKISIKEVIKMLQENKS